MQRSAHRSFLTVFTLLGALILGGCASGPPKPTVDYKHDYDFDKVKKVAFYHKSGQVSGDNPLQISDIQRNRVDRALQQALEKKGLQQELIAGPANGRRHAFEICAQIGGEQV